MFGIPFFTICNLPFGVFGVLSSGIHGVDLGNTTEPLHWKVSLSDIGHSVFIKFSLIVSDFLILSVFYSFLFISFRSNLLVLMGVVGTKSGD